MSTLEEQLGGPRNVVGGPFGSKLTQRDYIENGVPVIRGSNMAPTGRWVGGDFAFVSDEKVASDLKSNLAYPGDIIVTQRGTLGQVAIVPQGHGFERYVISQSQMAVRVPKTKADRDFVYYFLQSPHFDAYVETSTIQAGVPHINLGILRGAPAIWPEKEQQSRIGSILAALDDNIQLNWRMNNTLEAMARAIFTDWFVDFGPTRAKAESRAPYLAPELWELFPGTLDDEGKPKQWSVRRANELFEFNPRESVQKGTTTPYVDMAALPTLGAAARPPIHRAYKSGSKFRDGDTLFARITPCLENGKTAYVFGLGKDAIGSGSTEFIVIRSRAPVPKPTSYLLARDAEFRAHAERSMTGTSGRQRASHKAVGQYHMAVPDDDRLWKALGDLIGPLMDRVIANARASRTLVQTRDLLLPGLISGEIRLREAERAVQAAI